LRVGVGLNVSKACTGAGLGQVEQCQVALGNCSGFDAEARWVSFAVPARSTAVNIVKAVGGVVYPGEFREAG